MNIKNDEEVSVKKDESEPHELNFSRNDFK